jgi:hypothetical protein
MQINESKSAFISFDLFWRIGAFQRVTAEKIKNSRRSSSPASVLDRAFQTASHLPSPPHPAGQEKVDSANDNMYNKDFLVWQEKFGLLWR